MACVAEMLLFLLLFASLGPVPTATTCEAACEEEQVKQIISHLDMTVMPCDNFYLHSCGGFIEDASVDADAAEDSTMSRASAQVGQDIYAAIREMAADTISPLKGLHHWAARLDELCMNTSALESASLPTLQGLLDEIFPSILTNSSEPIASRYIEPDFRIMLSRSMAKLWLLGIDPFFVLEVSQDAFVTNRNTLYLTMQRDSKTGLFILQEYFPILKEHLEVLIQEYFDKLFEGGINRRGNASELIELQEHLVDGWEVTCMSVDCVSRVDDIASAVDFIDWATFFAQLFPRMSRDDIQDLRIIFAHYSIFRKLNAFIQSKPVSFIVDLALFHLSDSILLPKSLRDVNAAFMKQVFNVEVRPRIELCTGLVSNSFKWVVSRQYVDVHFDDYSRIVATEILNNIKKAFIDDLQRLTWMDNTTRSQAAEKAEAMTLKVGYPDWIKNDTRMLEYHVRLDGSRLADAPIPDTFLMAFYVIAEFQRTVELAEQGTVVVNGDWADPPIVLSPYYNNFKNDIVFTAAYLQPPLFDVSLPRAYLYGSVGSVMAHELTHGFDDEGRQRDKNGDLNNWWSTSAEANFLERANCYVQQYSNYQVEGIEGENLQIDGELTLGENIADNGGIQLSFLALRALMENVSSTSTSGNSCALANLSAEQLFFYGWAHIWCSKSRPETLAVALTDKHAPKEIRVKGSVANSEPFAEAFKCIGATGVPRCELWGTVEKKQSSLPRECPAPAPTPLPTDLTAPTDLTQASTDPTPAPTHLTPASTDSTSAPTAPSQAPTDATPAPANLTPASTGPTPAPTDRTPAPSHPTPAPPAPTAMSSLAKKRKASSEQPKRKRKVATSTKRKARAKREGKRGKRGARTKKRSKVRKRNGRTRLV